MKAVWEYISARAEYPLSKKDVMSFVMAGFGIFHVCLFGFFAFYSVYPMMIVAGVSVLLYLFCYIQARRNWNLLFVFNLSYAEIMIHAVLSVFLMGADSGFSLYTIAMLPLGYYAAYNFKLKKRSINPMLYVIFSVACFFFVQILGNCIEPLYTYENKHVDKMLHMANYLVAVSAIVVFFSTLLNQIKYLENQQMHQNKKLEELSKTDVLTGLANRRSIQERYAHSENLREEYALIMGDIDDFKKVNDTYGHNVGDQVLREVAEVFKKAVRGEDTVCRWGGEEILVFLPKCPLNNAKNRAMDILQNIRKLDLKAQDGTTFHITMTLGVAISEEANHFTGVVKKADERLYEGKNNGKNQVR